MCLREKRIVFKWASSRESDGCACLAPFTATQKRCFRENFNYEVGFDLLFSSRPRSVIESCFYTLWKIVFRNSFTLHIRSSKLGVILWYSRPHCVRPAALGNRLSEWHSHVLQTTSPQLLLSVAAHSVLRDSLRSFYKPVSLTIRAAFSAVLTSCSARLANLTWLILPVVICLSQRLSHACLSISFLLRNCEWLIITVIIS